MKIAVLCRDFSLGGAERIALRLGNQWASHGETVRVISGTGNGEIRHILQGDVAVSAPEQDMDRGQGWEAFAHFAKAAIMEAGPDLIFLPGNYYLPLARLLKKSGIRTPIAMKLSNAIKRSTISPLRNKARAWSMRRKMRFVDGLIVPHERFLHEACTVFPESRIYVALNPVLDDYPCASGASRTRAPGKNRLVMTAGRLVAQKNFELAIAAIALLPAHIRLAIYGEGPLQGRLEDRIRAGGLEGRVALAGFHPSLEQALADADIFLLSSDYEGFPSVVIEALAQNVPVVATDCTPTIAAHLSNPALGRVVPCGNAKALAQAISETLDQPPASAADFANAVKRYTLKESARAFTQAFHEIIARYGK